MIVRFSIFFLLAAASVPAATPPTIELPAEPPLIREVALEEVWRLDGEDEDVLMGNITHARIGADGLTYLLDTQLSQVLVIGQDGEVVTTLGREGDGPGEFRMPGGLFLMDDGTVGVIKTLPGKVVVLEADGTPGDSIEFGGDPEAGGFRTLVNLTRCGDRLVGLYGQAVMDMEKVELVTTNTLAVMDLEGVPLAEICTHTIEMGFLTGGMDEEAMFSEQSTYAAGAGLIYTVPEREIYTIRVRDLDGAFVGEYSRPFIARKRTAEELRDMSRASEEARARGLKIDSRYLDTDPAIAELHVSAAGHLFVRTCWDRRDLLPPGTAVRYDVISPAGEYLERVSYLIPEFDPGNDLVVYLDGDHFLLIRNADQARKAMFAGMMSGLTEDEDFASGDAEPLGVVFYRVP